jgi:preprotein translocase subunit SecD
VAPPSSKSSFPGRALAVLGVLLIVMLVSVIGSNFGSPGHWRHDFKVGLGLDLSSGTTVTLKAVTESKKPPTASQMTEARSIMEDRVDHAGFSGSQVQQQGNDIMTVSVPGKGATAVERLVGETALLRFRQVLLIAPNYSTGATTTPTPAPTPTPTPSASGKAKATPSPSGKAKTTPTPTPSTSTGAIGAPGGSSGQGLAAGAARLKAKPTPTPTASSTPTPSTSATPTPTPSATQSGATPPKLKLATTADGSGDASLLSAPVKALFNKVNCANKNWQRELYGTDSARWDNVSNQIVVCFQNQKYALDVAKVTGEELNSASASLGQTGGWQVNLNFGSKGAAAFAKLTEGMYAKYQGQSGPPQNNFAIVLDGVPQSIAYIQQPITTGQGQISGSFSESQANNLANVLSYGHLPLSFQNQSTESVSAALGSSQLHAGLIAAAIGLLLVVIYSFLYYRGLGLVSVSSLVIAALLSYLSVVLLSEYSSGFTLSLAGIAGLIVAIGITADSFVVYFERLRDEVREGRTLRPAVERGWQRARRTILVSDTVSFLAAALLWYFAIGDVKGFAFTLGLTTVIDIIVVFLFTKPMVTLLAQTKFFGNGHRMSGLDPARLGARSPWRGSRRPPTRRPATGDASASAATSPRTTPKEA